ncbi:hypothetical protein [Gimesia sp.]|uniref:hypothetical protein n=1 Tax=Gimesia sp. TaxID=2024833 RepID=UPI000C60D714|nr:hypothetical protein [Gimesia sp.]MAX40327.1 hypothetical protein [Gimesia sp.]HAH48366.1 hypothetical protein [Planctomycetaceae bacterium]HBL43755.1 hypothetical protein [Planctomycetaceae bacterium]|tara:strand:+ start:2416 stop:2712 length:297 start_codon:yes stop_codon:yes gene_type:complete
MFRVVCILLLLWPVVLTGCGGSDSGVQIGVPSDVPTPPPISLDEWDKMTDINQKYDVDTLDRLRASDPRLEKENAWDQFLTEVVVPKMKEEKPRPSQN